MDYRKRVLRLRRRLKGFDALLVTSRQNVRYLTGFTGSAGFVFIGPDTDLFVTDFRYKEQAVSEVNSCEVRVESKPMVSTLKSLCKKGRSGKSRKIKRLGFEPSVSYAFYSELKEAKPGPALIPMGDTLERMRELKDDAELALIKVAVQIAEEAFLHIKPFIRAGRTERSIALRLERMMKELGSAALPFEIIVASGPNSSKPHAGAFGRKFRPGDLVTIDWGAQSGGYCSDMTRTLLLSGGRDMAKKKRIYSLVKRANSKAIKHLAPGVRLRAVDLQARALISSAGYGEYFGHGLGHGVGLDVHEAPRLSPRARRTARTGMVVTIEPGIYVPHLGGVRIEDMAFVGRVKADVLTHLPVELEIIGS